MIKSLHHQAEKDALDTESSLCDLGIIV